MMRESRKIRNYFHHLAILNQFNNFGLSNYTLINIDWDRILTSQYETSVRGHASFEY